MLNERELATVLAALRYWQREIADETRSADDIATNCDHVTPLDNSEIDELCELLNLRQ